MQISHSNTLRPAWQYNANGIVWRIVPASGKLVGESRDIEKKETSFFCVNQKTGEVLWEQATFGEKWWIGIEAVRDETLLLHKFATPELPGHQSIIAVDVPTGNKLWQNDELKFESLNEDSFCASHATHRGEHEYARFDYRTGNDLGEYESNGAGDSRLQIEPVEAAEFPRPLFDLKTSDSPTNIAVRSQCNLELLAGQVECIEQPEHLIFSCYQLSSQSPGSPLNNVLYILDRKNSSLVFTDILCRNSSSVVPENFFVQNDTLFFVHERTMLVAIRLL